MKRKQVTSHHNVIKSIQVISPGSGAKKENLVQAEIQLEKYLKFKIFQTSLTLGCKTKPYLSAEDSVRLKELQSAVLSNKIDIIWCARGGYGSIRLMNKLWKMKKPNRPKLLIGYSDITTLHQLWIQKWNWISIHGPLFENLIAERLTTSSLKQLVKVLNGEDCQFKIRPLNSLAKNKKIFPKTKIVGGNLTTLVSSFGLPWQLDIKNKFLLLEEVNERGYKLDRMLNQLLNSKILDQSHGVLLADFIGGDESDKKNYCKLAIKDFYQNCRVPVYQIKGIGHGQDNFSIVLNQPATVKDHQLTIFGIKDLRNYIKEKK